MMDYTKLVEALRWCDADFMHECDNCLYVKYKHCKDDCMDRMLRDAAAAIEALQKRLVNALTALHLANEKMGYYGIQPYTEADGEDMISDWVKTLVHEELKQQLPKRGEWEREMDVNDEPFYQCSVCGECFDFNSDSTHEVFNYCPNCGADMRKMEVQE